MKAYVIYQGCGDVIGVTLNEDMAKKILKTHKCGIMNFDVWMLEYDTDDMKQNTKHCWVVRFYKPILIEKAPLDVDPEGSSTLKNVYVYADTEAHALQKAQAWRAKRLADDVSMHSM